MVIKVVVREALPKSVEVAFEGIMLDAVRMVESIVAAVQDSREKCRFVSKGLVRHVPTP